VRTEASTNFQHQAARAHAESENQYAPAWPIVENCGSLKFASGTQPRDDGARAAGCPCRRSDLRRAGYGHAETTPPPACRASHQ
jgi:hypothetical protein